MDTLRNRFGEGSQEEPIRHLIEIDQERGSHSEYPDCQHIIEIISSGMKSNFGHFRGVCRIAVLMSTSPGFPTSIRERLSREFKKNVV